MATVLVNGRAVESDNAKDTGNILTAAAAVNLGAVGSTAVTDENFDSLIYEGGNAIITLRANGDNEYISKVVFDAPATGVIYYDGVPQNVIDGKIIINNFDSGKTLAFNAGGYHDKGDFTLPYTATVINRTSGISKDFRDFTKVIIVPVTDIPVNPTSESSILVDRAGHAALATITLKADFVDDSTTEHHFFLISPPTDITVPADWTALTDAALLTASGMTGTVYTVTADSTGEKTFTLAVPRNFEGGDIIFKAGSYEISLYDHDPQKYQFSVQATATIGAKGLTAVNRQREPDTAKRAFQP